MAARADPPFAGHPGQSTVAVTADGTQIITNGDDAIWDLDPRLCTAIVDSRTCEVNILETRTDSYRPAHTHTHTHARRATAGSLYPPGPCPTLGSTSAGPATSNDAACLGTTNPGSPSGCRTGSTGPPFVPMHSYLAADAIEHAYLLARAEHRVEVVCGGGTGRTGTVIACMAILPDTRRPTRSPDPLPLPAPSRRTSNQRRWISWFATHIGAS